MRAAWALAIFLLCSVHANGQVTLTGAGGGGKTTTGCSMLLDGVTGAYAAYSFRLLRAAYAGKAIQLKRASDSTTQDIGFVNNCDFDTASATTFCNATTCTCNKWYDQTTNGFNLTGGTGPSLQFSSLAGFPSCSFTRGTTNAFVTTVTAITSPFSISTVTNRDNRDTSDFNVLFEDNSTQNMQVGYTNAASAFEGAVTGFTKAATNNAYHSIQFIFNGASSAINVDASVGTGTAQGGTTGTTWAMGHSTSSSSDLDAEVEELIVWNAALASSGSTVQANQKAYWGTP